MAELKGAKISRGKLRNNAQRNFGLLKEMLAKYGASKEGQVSVSDISVLQGALKRTKESIEKYDTAITRCMVLEDKDEDPDNEHVVLGEELEQEMDDVQFKIDALVAQVKEEHKVAKARADADERGVNQDQTLLLTAFIYTGSLSRYHELNTTVPTPGLF